MSEEIKRLGITRVADNECALLVCFSRPPTDEEMRNIGAAIDPGHQRFGEVVRERDQYDEWLGDALEERDARCQQIDAIADALGDEGEWTNLHDRGNAALSLAEAAVAEVESIRAENAKLRSERDQARTELVAAMQTIEAASTALGGVREQREQPGEIEDLDICVDCEQSTAPGTPDPHVCGKA